MSSDNSLTDLCKMAALAKTNFAYGKCSNASDDMDGIQTPDTQFCRRHFCNFAEDDRPKHFLIFRRKFRKIRLRPNFYFPIEMFSVRLFFCRDEGRSQSRPI